jgi:hypothetical protein
MCSNGQPGLSIPLTLLLERLDRRRFPPPKVVFLRGKFAIETFIHRENVALFKKGLAESRAPTRSETYS